MFTLHFKSAGLLTLLLSLLLLPILALANSPVSASPKIQFTQEEQTWLKAHPEIKVGAIEGLPPSLMVDEQGAFSGFLVDYLNLLTEHTGSAFQIELGSDWVSTLNSAKQRDTDMLGMVTAQPEHTEDFNFTLPILRTKTYIYGPLYSNIPGHNVEGLVGKRVGYIDSFKYIENYFASLPNIDFVPIQTPGELISALDNGTIDYIIHTEWFEYLLRTQGVSNYKVHLDIPDLETNAVMAVRNDWPELATIISKVLAANRDSMRGPIKQWLEFTKNVKVQNKGLILNKKEQVWLAQHPVIRVGIDREWAPVEFVDKNDKAHGISIEYLRRVEEILGIKFELIKDPIWMNSYNAASQGELDLLPSITKTEDRQKDLTFTAPYLSIPVGIFSTIDQAYLGGIEALKDKTVVVLEGYSVQAWLKRDYPELNIVSQPTITKALQTVAAGNAFAYIGDLVITSYYIGKSGFSKIKVVGETDYESDIAMGIRKDWKLFPNILQKALNAIPQIERDSIYNRWISSQYNQSVDYTFLWRWVAAIGSVLVLVLLWNRRLAKEITQRKVIESELTDARQKAEQATRNARQATQVKSQFLANMSHEIRTPMNAVISSGNLLHQTELSAKQHEYLNILSHSANTLLETIDGILDFSKGEANKLKLEHIVFQIDDILFATKQMFRLAASANNLELAIHVSPDMPQKLRGDSEKLGQILRNLVSNAIKFTENGIVDISVDLVNLDISKHEAMLRFRIRDTGKGISLDVQEQLFKPFTQAGPSISRTHGGTGLGLAITQQLTTLMRGELSFESTLNKGSTFTVELPFEVIKPAPVITGRPELNTPESPKRIQALSELSNTRVLLVEDHELNLFLGKSFLELFGTHVITAMDGHEALEALEKESVDLIFMDIQMPGMDGYETTRSIRENEKWKDTPIIALSAHVLSDEQEKCLAAGMNDYLSKPFQPDQLKEKLLFWAKKPV